MDDEWHDSQPIYRQLRDRVVALILEGALNEGDPLPSVRTVAADYRLNPITVLKARSAAILGHSGPLARAGARGGVSRRGGAAAAQWRIPMTTVTIEPAQRTAANVAGFIYLIAMATSIFAELYARAPLIVSGDAAQTAINIAASERLFRVGSDIHLITFASDAMLAVALYVALRPINRHIALLGAFWRLADCAILAVNLLNDFVILRLLSGANYLRVFDTRQLQALAQLFYGVEGAGFQIGFVFLGLGSAVFSYLWLRSRYIPRALAAWGIFASSVLALVELAIMAFPGLAAVVGMAFMAPMGIYEVGLGLWLLVKGLPGE